MARRAVYRRNTVLTGTEREEFATGTAPTYKNNSVWKFYGTNNTKKSDEDDRNDDKDDEEEEETTTTTDAPRRGKSPTTTTTTTTTTDHRDHGRRRPPAAHGDDRWLDGRLHWWLDGRLHWWLNDRRRWLPRLATAPGVTLYALWPANKPDRNAHALTIRSAKKQRERKAPSSLLNCSGPLV